MEKRRTDKKEIQDIFALTPSQEGMLLHYLKEPGNDVYVAQLAIHLSGWIDTELFEKAWNRVVANNDMLRARFRWEGVAEPLQVIMKKQDLFPIYHDLSKEIKGEIKGDRHLKNLKKILEKDRKAGFDLRNTPFRVMLCGLAENVYTMVISNHHILYDGWSTGILINEFFRNYQDLKQGKIPGIHKKNSFKQFVQWIRTKDQQEQRLHWKEYLQGAEAPGVFSIRETTEQESEGNGEEKSVFKRELKHGLEDFSKTYKVTLAAILYSAWGILLHKGTLQKDIMFGTTVSGRSSRVSEVEDIVGLFINTIPLRIRIQGPGTVLDLLEMIQQDLKTREPFETFSLAEIKKCSQVDNKEELFDTLVVLENYPLTNLCGQDLEGVGVEVKSYDNRETTPYNLTLGIGIYDKIELTAGYQTHLFSKEKVKELLRHFEGLVRWMIEHPNKQLFEAEQFSEEEKKEICDQFNSRRDLYANRGKETIHRMFCEKVKENPSSTALIEPGETLFITYKKLDQETNQLAFKLKRKGAGPAAIVGIMMDSSVRLMIGLLGILKAGAAYLPIDISFPIQRKVRLMEDSQAEVLITTNLNPGKELEKYRLVEVEQTENLEKEIEEKKCGLPENASAQTPAYVIYTSGSTGNPKGVVVEHRAVLNRLHWLKIQYNLTEKDVVIQKTVFTFDVSVCELLRWILPAGKICFPGAGAIRDPEIIVHTIEQNKVTNIDFVPSQLREFLDYLEESDNRRLRSLRVVFVGAEVVYPELVERFNRSLFKENKTRLINAYGPTEATVDVTFFECSGFDCSGQGNLSRIPIGKPMANVSLEVQDGMGKIQPSGYPGELYIAGEPLARGYLNDPETTQKKFVFRNANHKKKQRFYRTGDKVRWLKDGNIDFIGRMDSQIKIRGYRIEPCEIEAVIRQHPMIQNTVVYEASRSGSRRHNAKALIACYEKKEGEIVSPLQVKEYLEERLPAYMVPQYLYCLEHIPLKPNGKVDKQRLPGPETGTREKNIPPSNEEEERIAAVWKEVLQVKEVGTRDNFFDIGGDSLLIIRVSSRLSKELGFKIPLTLLFQYPTIHTLAGYLSGKTGTSGGIKSPGMTPLEQSVKIQSPEKRKIPKHAQENQNKEMDDRVAVIGMAGRFPGSGNIDEFWDHLKQGNELVTFFKDEELEELGVSPELIKKPEYVKAKGVLQEKDCFDSGFFSYNLREAEIMDPQMRKLHEVTWEALEHAGYDPIDYNRRIGLYVGSVSGFFWSIQLLNTITTHSEQIEAGSFCDRDFLSTRISYKLNLKGPAMTVQTACSTSLVAIDTACQSLLRGRCEIAAAGGVSITWEDEYGYLYEKGMVRSPDGHCRAFDAKSEGTVGGNGAGIVILKRLTQAVADRDTIHAVIIGISVNNDGSRKVGYTAPSVGAQAQVIQEALEMAGAEAESVGYIEAHGTGTSLGDPIEIEALKLAFNTDKRHYCRIGSVKTNIGHLDAAAGVAGFIKTILILKHQQIPPSLYFETPNPVIDWEKSPFQVNKELYDWKQGKEPLRAGVSSFGIGGTNAHVLLEEAPIPPTTSDTQEEGRRLRHQTQLLLLSAKTEAALDQLEKNLARFLKQNPGIHLPDLAYTLQVGRRAFQYRRIYVGQQIDDLIKNLTLTQSDTHRKTKQITGEQKRRVVFAYPGIGSQYENMGIDLYHGLTEFRNQMNLCFEKILKVCDLDLKEELYPSEGESSTHREPGIEDFTLIQLKVFVMQYSLTRLLEKWGIKPEVLLGYSFGEYTVACVSGVVSLEDTIRLILHRSQLIQNLPQGGMVSIPLPVEKVRNLLNSQLSVAIDNGESCIIAGPVNVIEELERSLKNKKYMYFRLPNSVALHSKVMEPVLLDFEREVRTYSLNPPQIPYISNVTGTWITPGEAQDPIYWVRHLRQTIRFADGVQELIKGGDCLIIEIGPGRDLSNLIQRFIPEGSNHEVLNLVQSEGKKRPDDEHLLKKIGQLWCQGSLVDWVGFYAGEERYRIPLPTYPFEKRRFPCGNISVQLLNKAVGEKKIEPFLLDKQQFNEKHLVPEINRNPSLERPDIDTPYVEPFNRLQKKMVELWQQIFGFPRIGIEDDFFELGGDSLKAILLIGRIEKNIQVKLPVSAIFDNPDIQALSLYMEKLCPGEHLQIPSVEKREYYPLSSAQKRLIFLNQLEEIGTTYNMTFALRVEGDLDKTNLEKAFKELIHHHESLRTSFLWRKITPIQKVHQDFCFKLEEYQLDENQNLLIQHLQSFIRPFDLSQCPLLRVGIFNKKKIPAMLVVDMHHIISDGSSITQLIRDFTTLYIGGTLTPLKLQYKDFTLWQEQHQSTENMKNQEKYWMEHLAGFDALAGIDLPYDYPRPNIKSFEGDLHEEWVSQEETSSFKELSMSMRTTPFISLLSVFYLLLYRYSGQQEIAVGTAISGRIHPDLQPVTGMFVNMLVMKIRISTGITCKDLIKETRDIELRAIENQEVQFEDLIDKLEIKRDLSRNPLFEVAFLFQNMENEIPIQENTVFKPFRKINPTSKFDLIFIAREEKGQLIVGFEYCSRLFRKATIERMNGHLLNCISQVIQDPQKTLGEIELVKDKEKQQLLKDFNQTSMTFPKNKVIHEIFHEQAEKKPGKIVLKGRSIERNKPSSALFLTYQEMDRRSNQLAFSLLYSGEAGPTGIVGIYLGPCIERVIAQMAVLKAGAAFVPISEKLPKYRIKNIIEDSQAGIILTRGKNGENLPKSTKDKGFKYRVFIPDSLEGDETLEEIKGQPRDPVYIIYTSGTMQQPRGVVVEHRALINLCEWHNSFFQVNEGDRTIQFADFGFDASVWEVFPYLVRGAFLCILDEPVKTDLFRLKDYFEANLITIAFLPTQFCEQFMKFPTPGLRVLLTGGDRLKFFQAQDYDLHNNYGPTENTVVTTSFKVNQPMKNIPIGIPIGNNRIYILSREGNLQPLGVLGECCVAGESLARGYLNQPGRTKEKFVPNPFDKEERIYRTGDLVRRLDDGNIQFIRRIDNQVKIRGFRIELEEIEALLLKNQEVKQALAAVKEDVKGDPQLCVYILPETGKEETFDTEDWIEAYSRFLSERLPGYMVPTHFSLIKDIPLTTNGKIDRNALPLPGLENHKEIKKPGNSCQEKILKVWSEVLEIPSVEIGVNKGFFGLGGHSVNAMEVILNIYQEFQIKIPMETFFREPTVEGLADYVNTKDRRKGIDQKNPLLPQEKKEYYPLSSPQKRLFFLEQFENMGVSYNIPLLLEWIGIFSEELLVEVLDKVMEQHESFRTTFTLLEHEPVQIIHESVTLPLKTTDMSLMPMEKGDQEKKIQTIFYEFIRPFKLSSAPLVRAELVTLPSDRSVLMMDMHHIISDGFSMELLIKDVMAIISGEQLQKLNIQYRDFAVWQNTRKASPMYKKQEAYWIEQYTGEIPVLSLPTDFKRPMIKSFEGNSLTFTLGENDTRDLKRLAASQEISLFILLFSLKSIFLSRLCLQDDIIIGTPVMGRGNPGLEKIIGMCVNTLPIRIQLNMKETFSDHLKKIKECIIQAFENQAYPFEDLVGEVVKHRNTSRNPLFDTMFTLQTMENQELLEKAITGVRVQSLGDIRKDGSKFDLVVTCVDHGEKLEFDFAYCTALFEEQTVGRLAGYFKQLICSVLEYPDNQIWQLNILPAKERETLLHIFNKNRKKGSTTKTLLDLFEEQVNQVPNRIALVYKGRDEQHLSYLQLGKNSDFLAIHLKEKGTGTHEVIGIKTSQSLEMGIGILGILKSGALYLPLEPGYPEHRLRFMIRDTGATRIIIQGKKEISEPLSFATKKEEILDLDSLLSEGMKRGTEDCGDYTDSKKPSIQEKPDISKINNSDPVYIIYTSGTTGRPKGVVVQQGSLANMLEYRRREYQMGPGINTLQLFSFSFDGFAASFFTPVISGAVLVMPEEEDKRDLEKLKQILWENQIQHFICVPALFQAMVNQFTNEELKTLETVTLAGDTVGEGIPGSLRKKSVPLEIAVEYGVSEATVMSTLFRNQEKYEQVFIGNPIQGTEILILDPFLELQPIGVPGELCIGGKGLSRGYLNAPEITAEKFIDNQLYRTGDMAKWKSDGNLVFLGRMDRQVKIRGHRIELEEIEGCLLQHPFVKEAAVITLEDQKGENYITAFLVPDNDGAVENLETTIREYLSQELPVFMLPSRIIQVDHIPLTSSGKIDRKRLKPVEQETGKDDTAPTDKVESRLVRIWAEVLGVEPSRIGIDTDFFEIGGHSLRATIVMVLIQKEFQVKVPLSVIFRKPRIKYLAEYLKQANKTSIQALQPLEKKEYYPLSSAQKRMFVLNQLKGDDTSDNAVGVITIEGKLGNDRFRDTIHQLIMTHEAFRTSFEISGNHSIQRIHQEIDFKIEYMQGQKEKPGEEEMQQMIQDFIRPFDLSIAPLLRIGLLKLEEKKHLLMFDLHHIISDAVSMGLLKNDFVSIYHGKRPEPAPIQYKEFSVWQNWFLKSDHLKEQESYWFEVFNKPISPLNFPTDFPRPQVQDFEGELIEFRFSKEFTEKIKNLCKERESSLYMVLLSAYVVLLHKYTGQEDIVVGTPIAGRSYPGLEQIIGFFVNTLAMRSFPQGGKTFEGFLEEVKTDVLKTFENQDYQFEQLIEKLGIQRSTSRSLLFDTMFAVQNADVYNVQGPENTEHPDESLVFINYPFEEKITQFDIITHAFEMDEEICFRLRYSTTLFKRESIDRFIEFYKEIVTCITGDKTIRIEDIKISLGMWDQDLDLPDEDLSFNFD
jgi:amino acid adenylation domain-containing protein